VPLFVEFSLLAMTLIGLFLGSCCIYWVNLRPSARRARWGRGLFVVSLLTLGGAVLLAALTRNEGLAPLGLLSGLLIVGMLWENPVTAISEEPRQPPG
jgi:hypothetical protein